MEIIIYEELNNEKNERREGEIKRDIICII